MTHETGRTAPVFEEAIAVLKGRLLGKVELEFIRARTH